MVFAYADALELNVNGNIYVQLDVVGALSEDWQLQLACTQPAVKRAFRRHVPAYWILQDVRKRLVAGKAMCHFTMG